MSAQDALSDNDNDNDDEDEDEDDDDAAIQAALKASMAETADTDDAPALPASTETSDATAETFSDPNYVKSLLEGIPGASLNDPLIQVATL